MIYSTVIEIIRAVMVLSAMAMAFIGQVEKANYVLLMVLVLKDASKSN